MKCVAAYFARKTKFRGNIYTYIYVFPWYTFITMICKQLMNRETWISDFNNYIEIAMSTRNTQASLGTHITNTGIDAADTCMHTGIVHCWLYSYIQSCSCVYSYGTPIRIWGRTITSQYKNYNFRVLWPMNLKKDHSILHEIAFKSI